jgi:hypothetical protein
LGQLLEGALDNLHLDAVSCPVTIAEGGLGLVEGIVGAGDQLFDGGVA